MAKEASKKNKKARKRVQSTKKDFQKIIDLLEGKHSTEAPLIAPYMDIYWAEESEVLKEDDPDKS